MKSKVLVAYENESSTTIRLTHEEIGVLVSKCPPDKLSDVFLSMTSEYEKYHDKDITAEVYRALNSAVYRLRAHYIKLKNLKVKK